MPIRINLLAEAQALEEMRRRDPVKRALWVGSVLVCLVLVWSSSLQLKAIIAKGEVNRLDSEAASHNAAYQQVLGNMKKLADVNGRLESLHKLASSRLLYGTLLNGLQQVVVDDVQVTRVRIDQSFTFNEEVKPKPNAEKPVTPRPASVTERVMLSLEARDSGLNPGDQVNKFKASVGEAAYFQAMLG